MLRTVTMMKCSMFDRPQGVRERGGGVKVRVRVGKQGTRARERASERESERE
jgi:hypothetical protein